MVAVTKDSVTGTITPRHSAAEVLLDCGRYAAPGVRCGLGSTPTAGIEGTPREDPAAGSQRAGQQPVVVVAPEKSAKGSSGNKKERKGRISLDDLFKQANRLSQLHKPHKANDAGWEAVERVRARDGDLGLNHFKLLKRLGCGDIGSVYLAELRDTKFRFAMKVMDLGSLASRRKQIRAETERDILSILDHPFLPTLYAHFETPQFLCLVMEYCAGGDLHTLRQKQEGRYFGIKAARFYAAEVLLALEYLHMMGVVYRDLKPENVLVRGDGHVMLSDFDLSLKCSVSPTLLTHSSSSVRFPYIRDETRDPLSCGYHPVSCLPKSIRGGLEYAININSGAARRTRVVDGGSNIKFASKPPSSRWKPRLNKSISKSCNVEQLMSLPELVAEPTGVRSMSFVGTHEYLAPEIISGDGHGSPVDWWTFGIFLFELLYGRTPFKGEENEITLVNVLAKPLEFPAKGDPAYREIDSSAHQLITALLVKDPQKRFGSNRGATEVKQHPFFEGINWALIRCTLPPQIPRAPSQNPKMKQKQDDGQEVPPSSKQQPDTASAPAPTPSSSPAPLPTPAPSPPVRSEVQRKPPQVRETNQHTKNYDMVGDSKERSIGHFEYF